ncbi:MAG: ABC transporter ATP-binding protein/permease [Acidobacteria bacterium]|nr:ABC transporter ATP-binding protein/permease [Acidobacteriota bacterium]
MTAAVEPLDPDDLPMTLDAPGVWRRGARLLLRYVAQNKLVFAVSCVGAAIYAAAAVGATIILGRITNSVIVPTFETGRPAAHAVWMSGLALLLVGLLRASTIILRRYFAAILTFRTQRRWRRDLADTYLGVPLTFHRTTPTGRLLAHADADIVAASEVLNPLPFSIGVFALVVFAVISLALVDWQLMLVGLVLFPGLAVINRLYTSRAEAPLETVQMRLGEVSRITHESIDGALVVKTLGRQTQEVERLGAAADDLRSSRIRLGRIRSVFEPMIDALPNLGIIVLLLIGSWQVSIGRLNTGQVVQAAALFGLLAFPMRVFGFFLQEFPRASVVSARLDRVMAAEREPVARSGSTVTDFAPGPLPVSFRDVSFRYGDDPPVLDHLDLDLAPGEIVALVGMVGSGKSTLCELLPRLVDPDAGSVRIGDIDLRDLDPQVARSVVALVFQETFLFADSVRENVTLGEPVEQAELDRVARIAHAAGFVARLPEGWDTVIGERGVTLSGGQRQRLALARALLRSPRVLVLDDATSAVDPVIESAILRDLRESLQTTTLVVAHRVSTIELADRVVHLRGGRIVASGDHSELLATDPEYARLVHAYVDQEAMAADLDHDDLEEGGA